MSKLNEDKYEPTLVYTSLIRTIARVRRFGTDKHKHSEDWRTTQEADHYKAMLRHIYAAMDGEIYDEESGLLHLAHAACNIMFEIERIEGSAKRLFVEVSRRQ